MGQTLRTVIPGLTSSFLLLWQWQEYAQLRREVSSSKPEPGGTDTQVQIGNTCAPAFSLQNKWAGAESLPMREALDACTHLRNKTARQIETWRLGCGLNPRAMVYHRLPAQDRIEVVRIMSKPLRAEARSKTANGPNFLTSYNKNGEVTMTL